MIKHSLNKVISAFSWKNSRNSALLWSLVLGLYVYSKTAAFANGYPTLHAREKFAALFSKTSGLAVILGPANNIQTMTGYIVWACYVLVLVGGIIWGVLLVTKNLIGDEQSDRFDILLSGKTDLKRLSRSIIGGLMLSLLTFFVVLTIVFIGIGHLKAVAVGSSTISFFSLAIISGIWMFMMLAALTSQLMSSRRGASSLALGVVGVSFMVKALGDITSYKWLLDVSPLGWFEKISPMQNTHPLWLIPVVCLGLVFFLVSDYLSGKRDLAQGIIKSNGVVKSNLSSVSTLNRLALRFNKGIIITWLIVLVAINLLYGLLSKTAVSAFASSAAFSKTLNHISSGSTSNVSFNTYSGFIFFINMILISLFAANCIVNIRKDEINGYDLPILTEPVSRIGYLMRRILVHLAGLVLIGFCLTITFWLGAKISGTPGLDLVSLMKAGLNSIIPALFIFGLGLILFGLIPRLSSGLVYLAIGGSVLISFVSSDLKINQRINDLSLFSHFKFSPAVSPDWGTNLTIVLITICISLIGIYLYNQRDVLSD